MRKTVTGFWWSPTMEGTPALIVTAAFFSFGSLLGYFFVFQWLGNETGSITGYLDRFLLAAQADGLGVPVSWEVLWRSLRWPVAAFFLGFTALGLIVLPVLSGLRGFYLSFTIGAFSLAYQRTGLSLAFLLLGIPALLSVPVFFILMTQSFSASWALAGRGSGQGRRDLPYQRDYFLRCGFCATVMCVNFLLERYLVPILIAGTAGTLIH